MILFISEKEHVSRAKDSTSWGRGRGDGETDSLLSREPAAQLNLRTLRSPPEQEADTQLTEPPGTLGNLKKKKNHWVQLSKSQTG